LFFYYFTLLTMGESTFYRYDLVFNAIYSRVWVAGDLIVFIYDYFSESADYLYGSSLPKLFGVINLNTQGELVRLPALIMSLRGTGEGGANTTFFTEGFANFGFGFDIAFIVLLFVFIYILFYFARTLPYENKAFYKLIILVSLIDVVHSDVWGFFHYSIVLLIIQFGIEVVIKRTKQGK